jgi:signal transduction histidine kinase
VVRHADARAVEVIVSAAGREARLTVVDDGRGLAGKPTAGQGLRNLAERAEALGGSFVIHRHEPRGTALEWRVPLP